MEISRLLNMPKLRERRRLIFLGINDCFLLSTCYLLLVTTVMNTYILVDIYILEKSQRLNINSVNKFLLDYSRYCSLLSRRLPYYRINQQPTGVNKFTLYCGLHKRQNSRHGNHGHVMENLNRRDKEIGFCQDPLPDGSGVF